MMYNMLKFFFIVLYAVTYPCVGYSQSNTPYAGELRKIGSIIKEAKSTSYKFYMSGDFPNGDKDYMDGTVYLDNQSRFMYNANSAFTLIYDGKWYYNANHREKNVVVKDINQAGKKKYIDALDKDIFGGMLDYYFDSVIMKIATVKKLVKNGDTVKIELGFPKNYFVKSIYMTYNEKARILSAYRMYLFEPWGTSEYGKDKGIGQTIVCWDFKKDEKRPNEYNTSNFFQVKGNNKIVLKKYQQYKLNPKT